jgi:NitT/TauT family transport system permease protein
MLQDTHPTISTHPPPKGLAWPRPAGLSRRWLRRLSPLATLLVILAGWHVITARELYPAFIIPPPAAVAQAFAAAVSDGSLVAHTRVTLGEMLGGLFIGVSAGLLVGYAIARLPLLEDLLAPIIVAFQSTPIVAYAPLLIIWFGSGHTAKIVTCAVIVFFPTLMNTIVGVRTVPAALRELMRSLQATPLQVFVKLEVPAALPVLLTGLKTSATLSVIGAVVGEFVSAGDGLGYLVTSSRYEYNTPMVYVAVLTMTALALALYSLVSLLEWRLLAWQRHSHARQS